MNFVDLGCCGMKELNGISAGPPPFVLDMACNAYATRAFRQPLRRVGSSCDGSGADRVPRQAIIIFSSADLINPPATYGDTFAAFLRDQKLGKVEEVIPSTKGIINPNTSRRLRVWHWYVDNGAFAHWRTNYIAEEIKKATAAHNATVITPSPPSPPS